MSTGFFSAGQEKKGDMMKAALNAGFAAFIRHEKSGSGYRNSNIKPAVDLAFHCFAAGGFVKIIFGGFFIVPKFLFRPSPSA